MSLSVYNPINNPMYLKFEYLKFEYLVEGLLVFFVCLPNYSVRFSSLYNNN